MCIYCGTDKYRKIYENHFGQIPKDDDGRTYDVHHKDGNHSNNSPENLIAVTIKEHYDIHFPQGDWMACWRMKQRMNLTPEEISFLSKKNAMERVANGTHNLLGPGTNQKRIDDGTHHFLGSDFQQKRVEEGTHHFLGPETNQKRIDDGSHNFLGDNNPMRQRSAAGTHHMTKEDNPSRKRVENGTHNFQLSWTCSHCGKSGKGTGLFARWHGDKCRSLKNQSCPV